MLFCYHSQEARLCIAVAALSVGISGIEVYRIALIEDYLLVLEGDDYAALEHEVELLTCVCNKLCGLVRGLESYEEGLHYLVSVAIRQVLEAVSRVAADALAVSAADDVICVDAAGLARDELIEIDSEFICYLIDDAYREVSVLLIARILLGREPELLCKLFL